MVNNHNNNNDKTRQLGKDVDALNAFLHLLTLFTNDAFFHFSFFAATITLQMCNTYQIFSFFLSFFLSFSLPLFFF